MTINPNDNLDWSSRKCRKYFLCHHMYLNSKGILTFFPFPKTELRNELGSTYSWLNCIVKKPLPFQWQRFSLCLDLTTTRIFISTGSTYTLAHASAPAKRLSTIFFWKTYSIGDRLSPVHFRDILPWQVSCYALFKEWLLLRIFNVKEFGVGREIDRFPSLNP